MDPSLLVVGAGDLGLRILRAWRARFPSARMAAETRTTARHALLREVGAEPRLRNDTPPTGFDAVVFCVPPSAADDYAAEARRAAGLGPSVTMVSSTAVYAETQGGWIEEDSPLAATPRAQRLLDAEAAFGKKGGRIVRLSGLYDADRGPHRVYRRETSSVMRPDAWINLVHLDDAASLVLAAAVSEVEGILLGTDGVPLRRQRLAPETRFEGKEGELGKRCAAFWTRARLGWKPRWPSFLAFEKGSFGTLPRRRASAIVVRDGKLLLTRQRDPVTEYDYRFLPGGGLEEGEKPVEAAARETREETGYEVRLVAPGSRLQYEFIWGGMPFECDTDFFRGSVIAEVGQAEFIVEWVPLSDLGRVLRYHAPLRDHVLQAVARNDELA